jgi:phosphoglycerate dehydrogenase-like enzyme
MPDMKIVRALALLPVLLFLVVPSSATAVEEVAPGVGYVPGAPSEEGIPGPNVGWVVLGERVVVVAYRSEEVDDAVVGAVEEGAGVPIGYVVETAPGGTVTIRGTDATLDFGDRIELSGGGRTVTLLQVGRTGLPGEIVAFVPDEKVLFSGPVCSLGLPDNIEAVDTARWIGAVHALERLDVRAVVPGRGPAADPGMLEVQQAFLSDLREVAETSIESGGGVDDILRVIGESRFVRWANPSPANLRAFVEHVHDEVTGRLPARAFVEELGLREARNASRDEPGWTVPRKVVVRVWGDDDRSAWLARAVPGVQVVPVRDAEEAVAQVADADAVVGIVTPEILEAGGNLRWVQAPSAGVERYLAMPGMRDSDVVLTNAQRLYGPEIAEHVIGMVLALTRGLRTSIPIQASGEWARSTISETMPMVEVRGKTMLVVGLGGIGTEVARLAHGIGMGVIATRSSRREGPAFVDYVGLADELNDLASRADVVVNCVPLTPATTGMFDAEFFAGMKPTAYFVNIGRGKSVKTEALVAALREDRIAGAALDVTDPEPLPSDHVLWTMPNVVITPHISARSDGAGERRWMLYRENLRRFVAGEPMLSVVNKERGY